MKKILIIHSVQQFERYCELEGNILEDPSIIILAFTIEIRIFLQKNNIPYIIHEKNLTEEQATHADNVALYIAENWYKYSFKVIGISLGLLVKKFCNEYFSQIIRNLHIFLEIIKNENPDEFITIYDNNIHIRTINDVLEFVCDLKKVPLRFIGSENQLTTDLVNPLEKGIRIFKTIKDIIGNSSFYMLFIKILTKFKELNQKLKKRTNKKKNILLYGKYYYHQSVVDSLSQKYNLIFLDMRTLKTQVIFDIFSKDIRGTHIFFNIYDSRKIERQMNKYHSNYLQKWNEIIEQPDFKSIFSYNNIIFWSLFKKRLKYMLLKLFKRYIKIILISIKTLSSNKYDLLIFDEDYRPAARFLSILASKKNIPSLVIQHGITGNYLSFIPTFCTKLAVWGKVSKEFLNEYGLSDDKIAITGSPRFDEYIHMRHNPRLVNKIKNSVYEHFEIKKDKKLVVVATTFNHFYKFVTNKDLNHIEHEQFLSMVMRALKNLENLHLIIKLHSGDHHGYVTKEIIEKHELKNASMTQDYRISHLIASCDCFITNYSTTAIEAMIMSKPIIIVNFKKGGERIPFKKYNVLYHVSKYEELVKVLKRSLTKTIPREEYNEFLEDYLYKIDGKSTKRILDLINELINN